MTYTQLAYLHLATIVPAFGIGFLQLFQRKGTASHRLLGRIYMILMLATAFTTLVMPAKVGPRFLAHFGFIHIFSVVALCSVAIAYIAIRRGNVRTHRLSMMALYIGGILIAGAFAFSPGRMLHEWLFG